MENLKITFENGGYPDPEVYVNVNGKHYATIAHTKVSELDEESVKNWIKDIYVDEDFNSPGYVVPLVKNKGFLKNYKTLQEFVEFLENNDFFSDLVDEAYWNDNFKADKFLEAVEGEAEKREIKLTDKDEFDYETYFYELYKATEKGLS